MFALTLKHPWVYAIVRLGKDVENRTWQPTGQLNPGDWFAIHGGVVPGTTPKLRGVIGQATALRQRFLPGDTSLVSWQQYCPTGIVAIVRFAGCVTESASPWYEPGGFGWTWSDRFVLPRPIACKGAQGLWRVTDADVEEIRAQWKAARPRKAGVES